jgi:hypothetical protein
LGAYQPELRAMLPISLIVSTLALIALLAEPAIAENRIESVQVASESTDEVVLTVVYSYDGERGGNVAISAIMANDGEVSAHYGYRPGRVERGRHRTQVRLGTTQGAPAIFSTNQIEVAMYVGGGEAFLRRQFSFAKTWSQSGATLPPVIRLAEMRPRLPLQRLPQAQLEQAPPPRLPGPADEGEQTGAVERRILPDGAVELHYPDGTIRKLFGGGETFTRPDGTSSTMLYQNAQPPTPPTAPPDSTHANWLDAENARLLDIMRTLVGHDEPSIQNYLAKEGADRTVYERIEARTEAVGWLVSP